MEGNYELTLPIRETAQKVALFLHGRRKGVSWREELSQISYGKNTVMVTLLLLALWRYVGKYSKDSLAYADTRGHTRRVLCLGSWEEMCLVTLVLSNPSSMPAVSNFPVFLSFSFPASLGKRIGHERRGISSFLPPLKTETNPSLYITEVYFVVLGATLPPFPTLIGPEIARRRHTKQERDPFTDLRHLQ